MKITITLTALERVEYRKTVRVPNDTTDEELDMLVKKLYDETDSGAYSNCEDYWEQGKCYWTKENE